jgi:flagellar motor switch protein FliN/FliY
MSSGVDAGDGGMLTQEALDAMLAEMNPQDDQAFVDSDPATDVTADNTTAQAAPSSAPTIDAAPAANPSLSFLSFNETPVNSRSEGTSGFDRVQDISLEIAVELGRTRLLIKDILELSSGSIIELEKTAGEPVDLLANGLLIARGEVVVVEDSFGVRVTQVITAAGRKEIADNTLHKMMQ